MKKKLLLIISTILIITLAVFGSNYLLSLHKVSFVLENGATGATIYRSNKQKIKPVTSSSHILLTKGDYYAIPEGKNVSQDHINFSVIDKDMTVTISPAYSKNYLDGLLPKEEPAVTAAIAAKYPTLYPDYTLAHGTLYKQGDWFGGLLEPKVSDRRERKDPYRIVLHKQNDTWQVVRRPEYILTSSKYGDVPIDVLRAINLITE